MPGSDTARSADPTSPNATSTIRPRNLPFWIAVFDEDAGAATQVALFPEDRVAPELACAVVQVKLSELQRRPPRQWGACWLACGL
jgi:hypothetical protein